MLELTNLEDYHYSGCLQQTSGKPWYVISLYAKRNKKMDSSEIIPGKIYKVLIWGKEVKARVISYSELYHCWSVYLLKEGRTTLIYTSDFEGLY